MFASSGFYTRSLRYLPDCGVTTNFFSTTATAKNNYSWKFQTITNYPTVSCAGLVQPPLKYFSTFPSSSSSMNESGPAAAVDALENPPSEVGQAHSIAILEIKEALKKVEVEITAYQAAIGKVEAQLDASDDPVMQARLQKREDWLRREVDKLREKEILLVRQLGEARESPPQERTSAPKARLDFSSNEAAERSIKKLIGRLPCKPDPFVPSLILLDKAFHGKIVGRDEPLLQIKQFLQKEEIPLRTPILALQGASGSGKSAFLDFLSENLRFDYPNMLIVNVSFNGRTSVSSSTTSVEQFLDEIVKRVVFAVFFDCHLPNSWEKFSTVWEEHTVEPVALKCLLKFVVDNTKAQQLVLCIDEVTKCSMTDLLLSDVGNAVDSVAGIPHFQIVTALDPAVFGTETKSDREIEWVPLSRLTDEQAESLFVDSLLWRENALLRMLIRDASGHPRTLSALYAESRLLINDLRNGQVQYSDLVKNVTAALTMKRVIFPRNFHPIILKPGVLGEHVIPENTLLQHMLWIDKRATRENIDAKFAPVSSADYDPSNLFGITFVNLLRRGYYYNTGIEPEMPFIPTFPVLQLWMWCTKNLTKWDSVAILQYLLVHSANQFIHQWNGTAKKDLDGGNLESFHAGWEVLSRRIASDAGLTSFFSRSSYSTFRVPSRTLMLQVGIKCNNIDELLAAIDGAKLVPALERESTKDQYSPSLLLNEDVSTVLVIGHVFSAYDVVILDRDIDNELHVTLVQCKYSSLPKDTSLQSSVSPLESTETSAESSLSSSVPAGSEPQSGSPAPLDPSDPFAPLAPGDSLCTSEVLPDAASTLTIGLVTTMLARAILDWGPLVTTNKEKLLSAYKSLASDKYKKSKKEPLSDKEAQAKAERNYSRLISSQLEEPMDISHRRCQSAMAKGKARADTYQATWKLDGANVHFVVASFWNSDVAHVRGDGGLSILSRKELSKIYGPLLYERAKPYYNLK